MKSKIDIPVDLTIEEIDTLISKLQEMKTLKFHTGDWIVYNNKVYVIKQVDNYMTVTLHNDFSGVKIGTKNIRLATNDEIEKAIIKQGQGYLYLLYYLTTNPLAKFKSLEIIGNTIFVNTVIENQDYTHDIRHYRLPTKKELAELNQPLPKSWNDYVIKLETCGNAVPCRYFTKLDTYRKLLILRDVYRDSYEKGWKPNWNEDSKKLVICSFKELTKATYYHTPKPFSFPTKELRNLFYENFKKQLEEIVELL